MVDENILSMSNVKFTESIMVLWYCQERSPVLENVRE